MRMTKDKTNEVVYDAETLSLDLFDGVALDFSLFHFDRRRFTSSEPYYLSDVKDAITIKLDVAEQVKKYKYRIDPNTLKWWESQEPAARKKIKPSPLDKSLEDFADAFLSAATLKGKIDYWWTRGNKFDPVFIDRIMRSTGRSQREAKVFPYNKIRDTRTYIDAMTRFDADNGFVPVSDTDMWNRTFVKHDSAYDIVADVLRMQALDRAYADMEPYVE